MLVNVTHAHRKGSDWTKTGKSRIPRAVNGFRAGVQLVATNRVGEKTIQLLGEETSTTRVKLMGEIFSRIFRELPCVLTILLGQRIQSKVDHSTECVLNILDCLNPTIAHQPTALELPYSRDGREDEFLDSSSWDETKFM